MRKIYTFYGYHSKFLFLPKKIMKIIDESKPSIELYTESKRLWYLAGETDLDLKWKRWFAWKFVITESGKRIWLRHVYRRPYNGRGRLSWRYETAFNAFKDTCKIEEKVEPPKDFFFKIIKEYIDGLYKRDSESGLFLTGNETKK